MWSICACVTRIFLTVSLCFVSASSMRGMSYPGSTTIASPDVSSPRMEQLQPSIPTGNVTRIIKAPLVRAKGGLGKAKAQAGSLRFGAQKAKRYFFAGVVWLGTSESTERLLLVRDITMVSAIEVSMKMIADQ